MNKELKNLTERQDIMLERFLDWSDFGIEQEERTELKNLIAKIREESMEYERKRIIKMLPQGYKDLSSKDFDKNAREYEVRFYEMFGYNRCLIDVKDNIKNK